MNVMLQIGIYLVAWVQNPLITLSGEAQGHSAIPQYYECDVADRDLPGRLGAEPAHHAVW